MLKMLWYRSNALGQPDRKKIVARRRGYHGVTIASGSLTGLPNNHRSFDLPIDRVLHTTCPHYWKEARPGETEEEFATRCAGDLETLIETEGPETIAAFFAEPVMGAGGVVVPPATYWEKIQAVLNKYDILLVADEVICGFGRTGRMFGSHTFAIRPDVMVMSKQITSSYVPFSAFMVNERFYAPIAGKVVGSAFSVTASRAAAIRSEPRSRSKTSPSSKSAIWWKTRAWSAPDFCKGLKAFETIHWWARFAGWVLFRRWNWSMTRPPNPSADLLVNLARR